MGQVETITKLYRKLKMKTILYLKSTKDDYEVEENEYLVNKLLAKGFSLKYFFILNNENKPPVEYNELITRLTNYLEKEKTDFIALHIGTAFQFYPATILLALSVIKYVYKDITIVLQPLRFYKNYKDEFDSSALFYGELDFGKRTEQMYMWLLKDETIFNEDETLKSLLWT
jgi:hypothetical protein